MRPTTFPSTSRTCAPVSDCRRTSGISVPSPCQFLDDVIAQPALPRERRRAVRIDVELQVLRVDLADQGPRNDLNRRLPNRKAATDCLDPLLDPRMNPSGQHDESELETIDTRLLALLEAQDQTVDASHERPFTVDELVVQNIANELEIHQLPPA